MNSAVKISLKLKIVEFWETDPSDNTALEKEYSGFFNGWKVYKVNEAGKFEGDS